ncbi:MAG: NHL repeat-containing protein [Hyphomicrobiales bacterium]|nr:NHL repeat-containing protein [Hyphomicrobiales bacterium]
MRVSLAPRRIAPSGAPPRSPFARADADVALGWRRGALAEPIRPGPSTLFGPRGAALHPDRSLWVCDTGHHRLLGWRTVPTADDAPADVLVGQPDFAREGRNAKAAPTAATLNVPTGICAWGEGLAVADAWNHRVLLWRRTPTRDNQPADIVLGQADASSTLANRGADRPDAATLHWPYGVASDGRALWVADSGNRRVLHWSDPEATGQPADFVLGHSRFDTRDENDGAAVGPHSMRWPHAIASWNGRLAIADAGNNRVMVWDARPTTNGAPCDHAIGQADFAACDHNRGHYAPTAAALNMPYALAGGARLLVADTANSRLLAFDGAATGAPAAALAGQPHFSAKGDNGWGEASRASLCWPYGLSRLGSRLAVADSGNNRVLLFTLAEGA